MASDDSTPPSSTVPPVEPTPVNEALQTSAASSASPIDEPLPDYEVLTPELMEDECLRGDVMLRWGALLLALLLSWTYVTETNVLVQVRSGDYLASHGLLPPRTDPFSATGEGRPWINLGWLSDLVLSLIARGGLSMLTVYGAATAFIAFQFLTRTNVPRVTTWWGSICAGLAAIALFPRLQPGTMSVTIVGLAALMWLIQRWRDDPRKCPVWGLPLLFVLWSNCDPLAFLGLLVLVAFCVGTLLTGAPDRAEGIPSGVKELWTQTALSVVATMVHPWHWHTLESGWVQLRLVPDEIRAYGQISEFSRQEGYGFLHPEFWRPVDAFDICTLLLAGLAFITQVMNISRFDAGLCLAWMASLACGAASGSFACYSSLVSAVVATLAGQEWYRANFSMSYSIDTLNVLFSRLGRAVTVLSGFVVAYIAVNGTLMDPAGRRVGLGLDPRWQDRIASLQAIAADEAFDDRSFPFRIEQGDLLVWLGQRPFVDSRLAFYAHGEENLLQLHRSVRQSLIGAELADADWKAVLEKYQTKQALARLWGPVPDYDTFRKLLVNPNWSMTGLSAAGAVFCRTDIADEELKKYVSEHQALNFIKQAFRDGDKPSQVTDRLATPRPRGDYDRWLYQPLPRQSPAAELAAHYLLIGQAFLDQGNVDQATALCVLAVREARNALGEDPNQAPGWRVLGGAERALLGIETQLSQQSPVTLPLRQAVVVSSYAQAAAASGDDLQDLQQLVPLHLQANRRDVALQYLKRMEQKLGGRLSTSPPGSAEAEEQEKQVRALMEQLEAARDKIATSLAEADIAKEEIVGAALQAYQNGAPQAAIDLIEKDLTVLATDPSVTMLYGSVLLDIGRAEEGWQQIEGMERLLPQPPIPPEAASVVGEWYRAGSVANAAVGNFSRAAELLGRLEELRNRMSLAGQIQQPFGAAMPAPQLDSWPITTTRVSISAAVEFPEAWASAQYQQALLNLESGNVDDAKKQLQDLLRIHPNWSQRILAVYFLILITGEEIPAEPPVNEIPVTPDLFAPDEPMSEEKPDEKPSEGTPAEEGAAPATETPKENE